MEQLQPANQIHCIESSLFREAYAAGKSPYVKVSGDPIAFPADHDVEEYSLLALDLYAHWRTTSAFGIGGLGVVGTGVYFIHSLTIRQPAKVTVVL
jgi:hypothetical protein